MNRLIHNEITSSRQVKVLHDTIDGTFNVQAFKLGKKKATPIKGLVYTTSDRKDAITAAKGLAKEHAK